MKIVGLTGPSGSGKSTAAAVASQLGFHVIDCDAVSRKTAEQPEVLEAVANAFGREMIKNGVLDRKALAKVAFADQKSTAKLNAVMLPPIIKNVNSICSELEQNGVKQVILDAPTLFESGLGMTCDAVVAVLAAHENRKIRIQARDNLSEEQLSSRLSAAKPDKFYTDRTSYVIYNNGSSEELKQKATQMFSSLLKL